MQPLIDIEEQQLNKLLFHTHSNNESEANYKAIQAYLQQQDLLALRGQVDIENYWQTLRELEINI